MPTRHIYFNENNYIRLKEENNISGLINNLLDDYFSKNIKENKKQISEEKKEIEELKKMVEIKSKEIEKIEEIEEINKNEAKEKLANKLKSIISLSKDVYNVDISEEEALKYLKASEKEKKYNLYQFLIDEQKVSLQADL